MLSLIDASAGSAQAEGRRFVMVEDSNTYGYLVRYQNPNHQGSCCLETDQNGDIISYEEYHPFGTTSYQAMNANITAKAKRYRYTGMERDEETGLNYHNARYYIPWLGRWMNCDPIGINDGINVFSYCQNNPVTNTDINGRQTKTDEKPLVTTLNGKPFINSTLLVSGTSDAASLRAATGAASGSHVSPSGAGKYEKKTQEIKTNIETTEAFKELNLIEEKTETPDPNAASKAGKLKVAGVILASFLTILTGGASLPLTLYMADQAIAGLRQMQSNLETQTIFELGVSKGFELAGAKKEKADLYASILHTGTGFALGGGGAFKSLKGSALVSEEAAAGGIQFGRRSDGFLVNASRAEQPSGMLNVAVHGTPNSVIINDIHYNHRVLAKLIENNPEFRGQPIRLLSCETGCLPNGFAKNLANKLGVPVEAPNNTIWAFPDGELTIGSNQYVNDGEFTWFWPGK